MKEIRVHAEGQLSHLRDELERKIGAAIGGQPSEVRHVFHTGKDYAVTAASAFRGGTSGRFIVELWLSDDDQGVTVAKKK